MSGKRTTRMSEWQRGYWTGVACAFVAIIGLCLFVIIFSSPANAQTAPPAPCYMQITPSDLEGPPPDFEWVPGDVYWIEVEIRRSFYWGNLFGWIFGQWKPLDAHLARYVNVKHPCADGIIVVHGFDIAFPCKCGTELKMRWRELDVNHQPFKGRDWHYEQEAGTVWTCPAKEEG